MKVYIEIQDEKEVALKIEICDILEYFMDFKQDQHLLNLKNYFKSLVGQENMFDKFRNKQIS